MKTELKKLLFFPNIERFAEEDFFNQTVLRIEELRSDGDFEAIAAEMHPRSLLYYKKITLSELNNLINILIYVHV
jgi:hypothetical protein